MIALNIKSNPTHHNLYNLIPFIEQGIIELKTGEYKSEKEREDTYLEGISEIIIKRESIFSLDRNIETLYTYTSSDSDSTEFTDFIKIPVCALPPYLGLSYDQIKHSRADLCEALIPFNKNFQDLSEQLFKLPYLPENINHIKQLCNDTLKPHFEPIQQSINNSIYLNSVKDKVGDDLYTILSIGIGPAELPANYYEKAGVISPIVGNEIKQRIKLHYDSNACFMFIYYKVLTGDKTLVLTQKQQEA